jgi:VIT1/CCC1 family predicted Fe2+/Mn2+ transporter
VGFVSGIASASVDRSTVLLSGIVLIVVEAFSMGVGSALSERSADEVRLRRRARWAVPVRDASVMFASYLLTGTLVLAPYAFWPSSVAMPQSIIISLALLFLLGMFSARVAHLPLFRRGLRMMLIGGVAIALGVLVARFAS